MPYNFSDLYYGRGLRNPIADVGHVSASNAQSIVQGGPRGNNARAAGSSFNFQKVFDGANKIAPYISNIANALRKTPRLKPPRTMSSVSPVRVNYDAQRAEADRMTRGANANLDRTLDENTAAAVKAGTLASNMREKNQITQGENNTNAMLHNDANRLNANIDAQNTGILNQYQRDLVEGQLSDQMNRSANLANAADKFVMQQNESNAAQLDRDKLGIMTSLWKNSGVYDRLVGSLNTNDPTGTAYMRANGGPVNPSPGPALGDAYYEAGAKLAHYKGILNDKLKAKNPSGFQEYFKGLTPLRTSGNSRATDEYIQNSQYNDYLSADEVKGTLGGDFEDYINSVKSVNTYNVKQGQRPLYGNVEGDNDLTKLNYGRRFASLGVTPTYTASNETGTKKYNRSYKYNPDNKSVDYTEEGDISLRPSTFRVKQSQTVARRAYGGSLKKVF